MPDNERQAPEPEAPELLPLEAHVMALRAELARTQLTLRLATGALLCVALALAWRAIREGRAAS